VSEGANPEQFEEAFPTSYTGAFESEFTFIKPDGHLHLPTAGIGEHNPPGIFDRADGLIGEQIPGLSAFAGASHHQGQRLLKGIELIETYECMIWRKLIMAKAMK
jgi:hypothetical protein